MTLNECFAAIAVSLCLASPPIAAQIFRGIRSRTCRKRSPKVCRAKPKIIQARQQVREMSQDALRLALRKPLLAPAEPSNARSATPSSAPSGSSSSSPAVPPARAWSSTFVPIPDLHEDAAGPGRLGFGVSQNHLIFVFTNEQALPNFIKRVGSSAAKPTFPPWPAARARSSPAPPQCRRACTSTRYRRRASATLTVGGTKFFKDGGFELMRSLQLARSPGRTRRAHERRTLWERLDECTPRIQIVDLGGRNRLMPGIGLGPAGHRGAGIASATTTLDGKQLPPPPTPSSAG